MVSTARERDILQFGKTNLSLPPNEWELLNKGSGSKCCVCISQMWSEETCEILQWSVGHPSGRESATVVLLCQVNTALLKSTEILSIDVAVNWGESTFLFFL